MIAIGSDQVDKVTIIKLNLHAYHFEEHKFEDAIALRERLESLEEDELEDNVIYIYLGPNAFSEDSGWYKVLCNLAEKGYISLFCIDKAHTIEQSGRSFRPEFITAVTNIAALKKMMINPVPMIAMSANFRKIDRDRVSLLFGVEKQQSSVVLYPVEISQCRLIFLEIQ